MVDPIALNPSPVPHHPECAAGCSGNIRLAGPCKHQCAKTPEFQEQSTRDAEAGRLRFGRSLGMDTTREVPPAARDWPEVRNAEEITPVMDDYLMKCCDCGLCHRFRFRAIEVMESLPDGTFTYEELDPKRYRVQLKAWRDDGDA